MKNKFFTLLTLSNIFATVQPDNEASSETTLSLAERFRLFQETEQIFKCRQVASSLQIMNLISRHPLSDEEKSMTKQFKLKYEELFALLNCSSTLQNADENKLKRVESMFQNARSLMTFRNRSADGLDALISEPKNLIF